MKVFVYKRMAVQVALALLALPMTLQAADLPSSGGDAGVEFDLDTLKQRGLDPSVAEFFRHAPRFAPGDSQVEVVLNGDRRGSMAVRFDNDGQPCLNATLLQRLGLKVPARDGADKAEVDANRCIDYRQSYPQMVMTLKPMESRMDLVVPQTALDDLSSRGGQHERGGTAALFNYSMFDSGSQSSGSQSNFFMANTEAGLNTNDWIFRLNQSFSAGQGNTGWQHQYGYAQHTIESRQSVMQLGEINLRQTPFAVGSLYGAQFFPEQGLRSGGGSNASVQGIAQSQARVEVRQFGALIFSTLVPPGPFTLNNLPILNSREDLAVTVIEADGSKREFQVSSATFLPPTVGDAGGLSFGFGKVKSGTGDDDQYAPWLFTVNKGWSLSRVWNMQAGLLLAGKYQSIASDSTLLTGEKSALTVSSVLSRSSAGLSGGKAQLSWSDQLSDPLSINFGVSGQTLHYRDLGNALDDSDDLSGNQSSYSVGLNWSNSLLGGFGLSYSHSKNFDGTGTERYTANWGRNFGKLYLSLNLERDSGGGNSDSSGKYQLYLNARMALDGGGTLSGYQSKSQNQNKLGTTYSGKSSDRFSYSVGVDQDQVARSQNWSLDMNAIPNYTQVHAHLSQQDNTSTTYGLQMSGGVVAEQGHVVFSPYAVRDTFALAKVGNLAGVKIDTPSGPVWTDHSGMAVIPSLPEYADTPVSVDTRSLPRSADLFNSMVTLNAGHGSVSDVRFPVVTSRRVLLHISMADGQPVPKGLAVLDDKGSYVATVASLGVALVNNPPVKSNLHIMLPDNQSCLVNYTLPDKPADKLYESIDAKCDVVADQ